MDVELLGNLGHRSVALADGCKRHLRLEGRGVIRRDRLGTVFPEVLPPVYDGPTS
jgi:hypothetical protein